MPMHNLLEYSYNYSLISGSLWIYYRNEINDDESENDANETMVNNKKNPLLNVFGKRKK